MRISVDFNTMQMDPKRRVYIGRKDSELDDQSLMTLGSLIFDGNSTIERARDA